MSIVLFDLDGTLIYSKDAILSSISEMLIEFGFDPLVPSDRQYFIGVPLNVALEHWSKDTQPMVDRFQEIYLASFEDKTAVYDGVVEMLEGLEGKVDLGIITLKGTPETFTVLDRMGLGRFFPHVFGDDGPARSPYEIKPHPEHFFYALWKMGFFTEEQFTGLKGEYDLRGKEVPFDNTNIIFIGDTEHDMIGASRAGLRGMGAGWGVHPNERLEAGGAEVIANEPKDVVELLASIGILG